jgi:hypothetical protein
VWQWFGKYRSGKAPAIAAAICGERREIEVEARVV